MKKWIYSVPRLLTNTALVMIAGSIGLCGVGLSALYILKYVDTETPEIVKLQCMLGSDRLDCPNNRKEVEDLQGKLNELSKKTAEAEEKLKNLRAAEETTDTFTLFTMHKDPNSDYTVTVGTVYTQLVEPNRAPEYYCYINLNNGAANENRNLYIWQSARPINLSTNTLRKAGVSNSTLSFAKSVCKPTLIGGQK